MASSFSTYDFSTLFTTFNPSKEKLTEFIEPFNIEGVLSLVLDDILKINNIYFDNMVSKTYPPELPN